MHVHSRDLDGVRQRVADGFAVLEAHGLSTAEDVIGEAIGAPERAVAVGTHYLNPPLLMPRVEVIGVVN